MDTAPTIEKFNEKTLKTNSKIQSSVIDRITHDIVNHLCIIC